MEDRNCLSSSTAAASCRCTSRSSVRCASRFAPGRLAAEARLPSTRGLAQELGVSRGVVTEAYGQLAVEGYLTTSQGRARASRQGGACRKRAAARALAAAELLLQLPPRASRPARLSPRGLAALAALGAARLAAGLARLRRPARRAGLARSARRLPGACARRRRRSRAHARVHRLHARASRCCAERCADTASSRWRSRIQAGICTG